MALSAPRLAPLTVTDVELLAHALNQDMAGLAFDRAVVPDRPDFPEGFLKGEWSLRLRSRQSELALLISLRPQNVFFSWEPNKGPRASEKATRSGFDLVLNKVLDGLKVSFAEVQPGDRIVTLWFASGNDPKKFGLVLILFPANPEALLIENEGSADYLVLARMRAGNEKEIRFTYPEAGPGRERKRTLPESLEEWPKIIRHFRRDEALYQRRLNLTREVRALIKNYEKRISQLRKQGSEAEKEPDYAHWGDLLKSIIGQKVPIDSDGRRLVTDWNTGDEISIPCDPKLSIIQQAEKFYALGKRKLRRLTEAGGRAEELENRRSRLVAIETSIETADLETLANYEGELGLADGAAPESKKIYAGFEGRVFFSQEGLPILVGKSSAENLALTFKFARGNDLWFHVRGKPGAHVVVPLRSKKNASLETLLDAACLAVYYSGGENWGKTEVDYTQKKHVKRIKDSTEASYTQNKTLIVAVDPTRLKRLKLI